MTAKSLLLFVLLLCCRQPFAQRYAVLLHEIMADPQPPVGLPDAEYVELRNTTQMPINLQGWRLQAGNAISGAFPSFVLRPDSLVVVTSRTQAQFFGHNTLGVLSFPALPNGGATLVLRNAAGALVHAVAYEPGMWGNGPQKEGGWSLEMMDAANPCSEDNWNVSIHPSGGTPGKPNSVQSHNRDDDPPALLHATAPDSLHLLLHFSESMDSAAASLISHYRLMPQVNLTAAVPQGPLFRQVLVRLQAPLQQGVVYALAVSAVADCAGNTIGSQNSVPAGLPQPPAAADVVINEILFNPKRDGADYIELFNKSAKVIDVGKLRLGNGGIAAATAPGLQPLIPVPAYIYPGQYAVLTEERDAVLRHYLVKNAGALWQVPRLPSMPEDKGHVVIWNEQGGVVDEVAYSHTWHFALLGNGEGVALERIDPDGPSLKKENWTSAAAHAGWGTPTYQNSQWRHMEVPAAVWNISPPVFSPDGDGMDDFCTIALQLTQPNYVANLRIFDAAGRPVRHLVKNETLPQIASWRWDGLGDGGRPQPTGTYILWLEVFNLLGRRQQWKKTVVLARR